mmetsp:Transcript_40261/g.106631  ORF Transcript_40261/g.106631 Transcript_40261/m.106631 type:complete len:114 (+) Transcript_40261:206-547(+)
MMVGAALFSLKLRAIVVVRCYELLNEWRRRSAPPQLAIYTCSEATRMSCAVPATQLLAALHQRPACRPSFSWRPQLIEAILLRNWSAAAAAARTLACSCNACATPSWRTLSLW